MQGFKGTNIKKKIFFVLGDLFIFIINHLMESFDYLDNTNLFSFGVGVYHFCPLLAFVI